MSADATTLAAALEGVRFARVLGAGGMAMVYLAHDVRHDREVAIKVLKPDLALSLGRDRFAREIRLAARLTHPHILPLYDSGEAGGFLYFVMPVMRGQTLRDRLQQERTLPVDEAVRIASEVAGALDYARRHDVVHRDIKPENILLHEGHAVVADFGIGKALAAVDLVAASAPLPRSRRLASPSGRWGAEPRTGVWRHGRRPQRPVRLGGRDVRDADGRRCVRGTVGVGHDCQALRLLAASRLRLAPRCAGCRFRRGGTSAREIGRRSVSERRARGGRAALD